MSQLGCTPNGIDESRSSYLSVDSSYPLSNAFGKGTDSTTFARWYMKTGGASITYVFYTFDCSSIPSNATIDSVVCSAKCRASNGSITQAGNNVLRLYSGDTAIGSGTSNPTFGTTAKIVSVPTDIWTREQLQRCMLKIQSSRGLLQTSKSQYIEFYGAELTIEYTIPSGDKFMYKVGGLWQQCDRIYKKVAGVWIEQTDLTTVIEEDKKYIHA